MNLRIKFRSANLDQFIERYGVDVSRGGIFIRTREPLAVGTQLRFDFQLQDAAALLAGEGTVVWIRENDPSRAGVTPGMGVRFDKLNAASQPILEKILTEKGKRDQSTAAKPAAPGGLAVRRPSSTFSALDPAAARASLANAPGAAPKAAAPATGSGPIKTAGAQPRATAPATGSGPIKAGAVPRAAAPATGSGPMSTSARPATLRPPDPNAPLGVPRESSGAFGRPRTTTGMNAARPAPAPQALFEKPTADDIDRALSVLTEVDEPAEAADAPAPPVDFGAPRTTKSTDVHPLVLESSADVGDAPARRTGTRPLFTAPELRAKTVPVVPIGGPAPGDDEEDATTAWQSSGPTRIPDDAMEEVEDEVSAPPAASAPPPLVAPPPKPAPAAPPVAAATTAGEKLPHLAPTRRAMTPVSLPTAPAPTGTENAAPTLESPGAGAPKIMAPAFTSAAPKKKRSAAPLVFLGLFLLGGGAAFVLKGMKVGPFAKAPETAPAPEATAAPAPGAVELPPPPPPVAGDAGGAPVAEAKPTEKVEEKKAEKKEEAKPAEAKPAEAKPDKPNEATPLTLRARPLGPPEEPPKPAEAKPAETKPAEDASKSSKSRSHRREKSEAKPDEGAAPAEAAATTPPAEGEAKPSEGSSSSKGVPPPDVLKITSTPAGAEVIVDGLSVGTTPYSANDVDPSTPHSITLKKDGFEAHDRMISGSDWSRGKGGAKALKINVKLRSTGGHAAPAEAAPAGEAPAPAEPPPGLGTTPTSPKRE